MVKPIPPHFFTVASPGLFSVGVYLVIRFYFSIEKADQSNFLSIWGAFGLSLEWEIIWIAVSLKNVKSSGTFS